MFIVPNRLGAEKTYSFRLRSGTLSQLLRIVYPSSFYPVKRSTNTEKHLPVLRNTLYCLWIIYKN